MTPAKIEKETGMPEVPGLRRDGAVLLGLGLSYTLLFCYAVHAVLPFNPIKLPYESELPTTLFLPEGWKFFTRNPQEEQPLVFSRQGGSWRSAARGPHASAANLFGLDRAGRAQGLETGLLIAKVPERSFTECKQDPAACLERAPVAAHVKNISPDPTLCGPVGIVLRKPVPWAWARTSQGITMPSRIARLEIQCWSE